MVDREAVIQRLKKSSFSEAYSSRIPVCNQENEIIGCLVPVGLWILENEEKIKLISSWRQLAMRMFLTQFESTSIRTREYLENLSIREKNRIFFLLYDIKNRFIGHMGMAGISGETGELDNLMRGLEGGDPRLIFYAEITLLDWCFNFLAMNTSHLRVLSYNWLVISLHQEVGYIVVKNIPLRKVINNGVVLHESSSIDKTNVRYSCTEMLLRKEDFYRRNNWLTC